MGGGLRGRLPHVCRGRLVLCSSPRRPGPGNHLLGGVEVLPRPRRPASGSQGTPASRPEAPARAQQVMRTARRPGRLPRLCFHCPSVSLLGHGPGSLGLEGMESS